MTLKRARNVCAAAIAAAVLMAVAAPAAVVAEPKVPSTPEEHFALAKQYKDKAEEYRKEAKQHQDMAASYKNSAANAHEKGHGQKNPWVVKMEKHCGAIAAKAEALAKENEKAADFHDLRGKELQGK